MTNSIALGRAAARLSHFASGVCLALVVSAFFHAADAQFSASTAVAAPVCAPASNGC